MRSDSGRPGMTALSNGFRLGPLGIRVRRMGWPIHTSQNPGQILYSASAHQTEGALPLALAPSNSRMASLASRADSYVT